MDKQDLLAEESVPFGDDDIRRHLPDARIMTYKELSKHKSLDELLPKDTDYAIILYEDSPNHGHWTALSKHNKMVEFFDSYGGYPDSQQKWVSKTEREQLGEGKPFLSHLLNECPYPVRYNHVHYQKADPRIADCGRHCVNRIKSMLEKGYSLDDYKKWMDKCRKKLNLDYDGVVTTLIT
jgi:hypothetical protein